MENSTVTTRNGSVGLAWAALAVVCVVGLGHVSRRYDGFALPYGYGVQEVPGPELVFYLYLLVFATPATYALGQALLHTDLPARAIAWIRRASGSRALPLAVGLLAGGAAALIRTGILVDAPVSDDESTYAFIAQTLLEGRVVNPAPPEPGFFVNQFIVLDGASWYGKYPIGHPAVLALGEAFGLRAWVAPVITGLGAALTFAIGRRAFGARIATVAALLLLVSPQFLFTGATQLSQTTSGLCLLVAVWSLLAHEDGGRWRHALLAGTAFGAGILVRPLPGALFLAAAGIWWLLRHREEPIARLAVRLACAALPVAACGLILMAVFQAQTGSPTESGYHTLHGGMRGSFRLEWVAPSVAGALLRQNFWLFGWPLSFALLPFAARTPQTALLWGLVAAEYAYRVLFPKTVVAATGPVYVAEIVPLLALLSASGLAGLTQRLSQLGVERARERVAGLALAAVAVAAVTFLPAPARSLHASGMQWQTVHHLLDAHGGERALVFADHMVAPDSAASWAYYPPNPSPRFDDARVFVRIPKGPGGRDAAVAFWRRRFPHRDAWVYQPNGRGGALLPLVPHGSSPVAADGLAQRESSP